LNQPGRYDVPFRIEKQSFGSGGGSAAGGGLNTSFASSTTGLAVKGAVCPNCHSVDCVQTFSLWHGVLAICLFPIGLLGFAFPVKRCVSCGTLYGAGREMTRVLGIIALIIALLVAFVILRIAGSSQ